MYYIFCTRLCASILDPRSNLFFAFMDGHYITTADIRLASYTDDILEAARMLDLAKKDAPGACIVTVKLDVSKIDVTHQEIKDRLIASAKAKLTQAEYAAITQKG
jgi:hypothetical protein